MTDWLNQGDPAATILIDGAGVLAIVFVLSFAYFWIKNRCFQ